jgi:hypothetical protein
MAAKIVLLDDTSVFKARLGAPNAALALTRTQRKHQHAKHAAQAVQLASSSWAAAKALPVLA